MQRGEKVLSDPPHDAATAAPPLLEAAGLAKSFNGVNALSDGCLILDRGSVHALCGGNGAGKSTLVSILSGLLTADAGEIRRNGAVVDLSTPMAAAAAGIAIITQEMSLVPELTVAENIWLGREPHRRGLLDRRAINEATDALMARLGFGIAATARISALSLAQAQLVEIAKAIGRDADVLIMDEPTSALGSAECEKLFAAIATLKARGVGIVYISHRLAELFAIADRYTVMRGGAFVECGAIADIDKNTLVTRIVGRELAVHDVPAPTAHLAPLLRTTALSRHGAFQDINVEVGRGEIVGFYGLAGSGRSAVAAALGGVMPVDSGTISIDGTPISISSPGAACRAGIALIPADRKLSGLVLQSSIRDNLVLTSLPAMARYGILRAGTLKATASALAARFGVRMHGDQAPVGELSGGNQQKVLLARCLATNPRLVVCNEPTRGVDEEARRQIHQFLQQHAQAGNAVIMISSEAEELIANCHRIYLFKGGGISSCVDARHVDSDRLAHLAN